MLTRLPADERRAQLVESALTIAERRGVASVTVRAVAEEAGVSLGVVHYCFESKEELLAAMGESLVVQLSESMRQAFGEVKHAPELRGIAGLRELLKIGIGRMVPTIEETPDRQLLTYEITAQALRHRATASDGSPDIAGQQYRRMDGEAIEFLSACAEMSGVRWGSPVEGIARFGLACVDGVVLRWLVDRDDEAMRVALDETVLAIAAKAVELQ
ncbi:TetR family transcriptional regulator [Rhodococcus sp. WMMA185]|uniref:TetR/AcrR family transcriptional regulator n=1 Tax=Rhodococcus sp. WMMA185 TaxID=679318 RepID=UPI000878BC1F|nr:TetR family transcriptional regulator [Rhodococcus sp. WMMA185]AOW92015.1 TetR family transcriptional regulator [Rhodococcus sp. WMMA185]